MKVMAKASNLWVFAVLIALFSTILLGIFPLGAETVKLTYDEQGRLTSATYGSSGTIQYKYDAAGNVVTVQETVTIGTAADSEGDDAKGQGSVPLQSVANGAGNTDPLVSCAPIADGS